MAYKISWSNIALEDYKHIIEHLISSWPLSIAIDFANTLNRKLTNLSMQPFNGIKSNRNPTIRSILISKHNRLYYRINDNHIELLSLIDTRMDPAKNPF